jgi:hypothetical protein
MYERTKKSGRLGANAAQITHYSFELFKLHKSSNASETDPTLGEITHKR